MKKATHVSIALALSLSACAGVASEKAPAPEPAATPAWVTESERLTAAESYDRAVLVIEDHLEGAPDDADAWRGLARALERLVNQGGGSFLAMEDARDAWDRARELEPLDVETLHGAADVRFRLGEYAPAAELASLAIGQARVTETEIPDGLLVLRARARVGAFQNAEHADVEAYAADLEQTFHAVERCGALDPGSAEITSVEAGFCEWLGVPETSIDLLGRAIPGAPDAVSLHQSLVNLYARQRIEERLPDLYASWCTESNDPTLIWYHGFVLRVVADSAQRERDFEAAVELYGACIEVMDRVAATEASFTETANQVAVQAKVSKAWCALGSDDPNTAEIEILSLLQSDPELRELKDGLGRSLMNAIAALGERWVALSQFERAAHLSRAVLTVTPEDGEWWNNLGFLLREYGTQMEGGSIAGVADPKARSVEIFRESWQAYLKAAELKPDDARVINDGALIQVYHLQDELERAEKILWHAIAIGEAQLEELGADPDEAERFPVAQAVGDAYENLGYLYYHVLEKPQESREYWVKSIATDSGDRVQLEEYLAAIDGQREPVELRDSAAFLQEPRDALPERAAIDWESSFDNARERAAEEKRTLLVYNRGLALGLAVPFLDEFATGERFGETTAAGVVVIADGLRHAFVDRLSNGRRLLCPKWGTITCAEHIRCAEEFNTWYEDTHGAAPGESEEGFWIRKPEADELTVLDDFTLFTDGLPEVAEANAAGFDLEAAEASLQGEEPDEAARELVTSPLREAHDLVEATLFDREADEATRRALVLALAADQSRQSLELLSALVRQDEDTALALMALDAWPAGLTDLGAVQATARWSTNDRVRAAANEILIRDLESYDRVRAAKRIAGR